MTAGTRKDRNSVDSTLRASMMWAAKVNIESTWTWWRVRVAVVWPSRGE